MNEEVFKKSTFSEEEIFHPKTLEVLRNESLFIFKQQYSSYYASFQYLKKTFHSLKK